MGVTTTTGTAVGSGTGPQGTGTGLQVSPNTEESTMSTRSQGLRVVAGAGGFIGGHVVRRLLRDGHAVRAVDCKAPGDWHQRFDDAENLRLDLGDRAACVEAVAGAREVYNFAADMGGMGFIENNKAACMLSVLVNTHLLVAARDAGVERYFFASSACVYAAGRQTSPEVTPLKEPDAYPAMPEDGYGWEKLFSERMCRHFTEDFGLSTRVARLHNVYGPFGTFAGGREKAPAAICRKVVEAVLAGGETIEIWGDGAQTRSFMFVDDCVEGVVRMMREPDDGEGRACEPMNLGSSELVSIDGLVDIVEGIAGVKLVRRYDLRAPQGVRGRNSDNTLILSRLGWEPSTTLQDGMRRTFEWIYGEMAGTRAVTSIAARRGSRPTAVEEVA